MQPLKMPSSIESKEIPARSTQPATIVTNVEHVTFPDTLTATYRFGPNAGEAHKATLAYWRGIVERGDTVHPYPDMNYVPAVVNETCAPDPFAPRMTLITVVMERVQS